MSNTSVIKYLISPWTHVRYINGSYIIGNRSNNFSIEFPVAEKDFITLLNSFITPISIEEVLSQYSSEKHKLVCKTITDLIFKRFILVTVLDREVLKPQMIRNPWRIEIDITWECDINCINCDRSCRKAPTNKRMTVDQINKFINEAISNKMKFEWIYVSGGESTLHPDLIEILNLLLEYKNKYSKATKIQLYTNGFSTQSNSILKRCPDEIIIENSCKKNHLQKDFQRFNDAPIDNIKFKDKNWNVGCSHSALWAMGLGPYGYYQCPLAAGIDRVLGSNIGRKEIPSINDNMLDQSRELCKYCGIMFPEYRAFSDKNSTNGLSISHDIDLILETPNYDGSVEKVSNAWLKIYENYKNNKPALTEY